LNCNPSWAPSDDWTFETAAEAEYTPAGNTALPASKDLRAPWWAISNQGSTGASVGWATADLLRWHFVKAARLTNSQLLSPRFLWIASKELDPSVGRPAGFIEEAPSSLKAALEVARKYGVVRDTVLPFANASPFLGRSSAFYAIAAQRKILAYFNLGNNLMTWRSWLANNGPILARLDVDQTWDDASKNHGYLDEYRPETARGGHAVVVVGYTKDRFIIRNSWGTGWGDEGFGLASLAYAWDALTETYGVEV
jgi:hypothetical protein